ncbi:glycoside hydrolase [Microthyrium microscopicum]|uniref:Probable beta-glucosidase btgE n=1 Tax=Microthyrium microscopicum TaxID=703497 RepID=A0A6A6USR6_9PEZI|nr:glycoside hydrolase [Microthyrium microscopicum]
MKSTLVVLGSLVGGALSLHARHADFHQKKDLIPRELAPGCCKKVVTVTVYEDEAAPTTTVSLTSTEVNVISVTAVAVSTPVAPVVNAQAPYSAPAPAPSAAAPSSAAAPAASSAPASTGGIVANGQKWGFTYTPYSTADGSCLSAGQVLSDLTTIKGKGFTTVRVYGTDCDTLDTVGAAARTVGLKLILGVFIKADGIAAAQSQIPQIVTWGNAGNWDLVVMLVVGNEAISSGFCDGPSLAAFVSSAKSALTAAGQGSIPVTTTEVVSVLGANKGVLCPVVDIVAANIETFFDGSVIAANAGDFAKSQLDQVSGFCPGKTAYNLESGWPMGGPSNGASVASPEAQNAAIADIINKVGDKTVIFSFGNDMWKPAGVDQNFGCIENIVM